MILPNVPFYVNDEYTKKFLSCVASTNRQTSSTVLDTIGGLHRGPVSHGATSNIDEFSTEKI